MTKIVIKSMDQTIDLWDDIDLDKEEFESIDSFVEYLQNGLEPGNWSRDKALKKFMNSVEIVDKQELDDY